MKKKEREYELGFVQKEKNEREKRETEKKEKEREKKEKKRGSQRAAPQNLRSAILSLEGICNDSKCNEKN
jgi:hypothetical protein